MTDYSEGPQLTHLGLHAQILTRYNVCAHTQLQNQKW